MMKAHIDFLFNGHDATAEVEYGYSIEDDGTIHIDDVWLGGCQVRQMLDRHASEHLMRCARRDWEHSEHCRAKSRQATDFAAIRQEALDGDLVGRNRRAG